MGYFDDLQLLNVIQSRIYGSRQPREIVTDCYYMGIICGQVIFDDRLETRPFVYFTPQNLRTITEWKSPAGAVRDNFYIECTGERAGRIFAAFDALTATKIYPVISPAPYIAILKELQQLFLQGHLLNKHQIILRIEEFAAYLDGEISGKIRSGHAFEQLLTEINHDPGRNWNFNAIARKSGLSLRHWNRLFHAASGMPPYRFVIRCRLHLARVLLAENNLSIKEISTKCGFDDPSGFSRFFRKNTGISPGEYRRRCLR